MTRDNLIKKFEEKFCNPNAVVYGGDLTDVDTKFRIKFLAEEAKIFLLSSISEILEEVVPEEENLSKANTLQEKLIWGAFNIAVERTKQNISRLGYELTK